MDSKLVFAAVPMLALLGCASPSVYEADTEHSRAYHLAHAAGLWKARDFDVPIDQREGLTHATYEITSGTALFNSSHGLGLSFGDALGVSLVSFLLSPPGQLGRNTVLAWIPSDEANSPDEAVAVLTNAIYDASVAAFDEAGIEYEEVYRNKERKALWHSYYQTAINFTDDGKQCGIYYHFYPDQVSASEVQIPEFILSGEQYGYRFWAPHELRYPRLNIGCPDADPAEGLKYASLISEKLPEGVYFYMAPRSNTDRTFKSPPVVLDQGEALLFLTPER